MFYLLTILICMIIIIAFNAIFLLEILNVSFWFIVLTVILSVLFVIAIDGIFAFIIRWLMPKKLFSIEKTFLTPSKKECLFYEKIGIKKWKDKVPELGFFAKFRKNKIVDPSNNEYVERFIVEDNYGIAVHVAGCVFGFLVMLFFPEVCLSVGLPVAIVNLFLNLLSFCILRYTLPKLRTLYRINEKRAKRKQQLANE